MLTATDTRSSKEWSAFYPDLRVSAAFAPEEFYTVVGFFFVCVPKAAGA